MQRETAGNTVGLASITPTLQGLIDQNCALVDGFQTWHERHPKSDAYYAPLNPCMRSSVTGNELKPDLVDLDVWFNQLFAYSKDLVLYYEFVQEKRVKLRSFTPMSQGMSGERIMDILDQHKHVLLIDLKKQADRNRTQGSERSCSGEPNPINGAQAPPRVDDPETKAEADRKNARKTDLEKALTETEPAVDARAEGAIPTNGQPETGPTEASLQSPLTATIEQQRPQQEWKSIKLRILSEQRVQIFRDGNSAESLTYAEMGFADRRQGQSLAGKPNQGWQLLLDLAQNGGILKTQARSAAELAQVSKGHRNPEREIMNAQVAAGRSKGAMQKRIERLRETLQKYFKISSDPIPFREGVGYQASFLVEVSRSFDY